MTVDDVRRRVFISYAHASDAHIESVRQLWMALRWFGVDARLDLEASARRQDWTLWMLNEFREADFVVVVASQAYQRRADGEQTEAGRGVQFEGAILRDLWYEDRQTWTVRTLPVILPGESAVGIPRFLGRATSVHYTIESFTLAGLTTLLRVITGQPAHEMPPLGEIPVLTANTRVSAAPAAPKSSMISELGKLADAMGELPELSDANGRRQFLLWLPPGIRNVIDDAPNARTHVISILRGCARFGVDGRTALLEILECALPPDAQTQRAIALVSKSALFAAA